MFVASVPHTHIEDTSGDESTINDADEETDGEESREILGYTRENANHAPDEGKGR